MPTDAICRQFVKDSGMGDRVERGCKIKEAGNCYFVFIGSFVEFVQEIYKMVSCRMFGEEPKLVRSNEFVGSEVFQQSCIDDSFHPFAYGRRKGDGSVVAGVIA